MAWVNIAKTGNIWAYENGATAAHTYTDAPGTYSGGIRSFDPPGATPVQATYVRCRMVADSVERGELSKTFWDAQ
jgi:hypothetical protein